MNIVKYEQLPPMNAVPITTAVQQFLDRIEEIVTKQRHSYIIKHGELNTLQLTQAIGNSQNFLTSGIIQLRGEMILCARNTDNNQEILIKGLERFFQVFTQYQENLRQGLINLASHIQTVKEITGPTEPRLNKLQQYLLEVKGMMTFEFSNIKKQVEDIQIRLNTAQHTYPYQGVKDAISNAQQRIVVMEENMREEVLQNFDRNIKLMEDTCSAILSNIDLTKGSIDSMKRENQNNLQSQVIMLKEIYGKVANIHDNLSRVEKATVAQDKKIDYLIEQLKRNNKILTNVCTLSEEKRAVLKFS